MVLLIFELNLLYFTPFKFFQHFHKLFFNFRGTTVRFVSAIERAARKTQKLNRFVLEPKTENASAEPALATLAGVVQAANVPQGQTPAKFPAERFVPERESACAVPANVRAFLAAAEGTQVRTAKSVRYEKQN